jgi:hypothetical protein
MHPRTVTSWTFVLLTNARIARERKHRVAKVPIRADRSCPFARGFELLFGLGKDQATRPARNVRAPRTSDSREKRRPRA